MCVFAAASTAAAFGACREDTVSQAESLVPLALSVAGTARKHFHGELSSADVPKTGVFVAKNM